jgi:uncharacterized protein
MTEAQKHEIKFAADKTLGRLVRWLRVIGQDVIHGPHLAGQGLVRFARQGNRMILTRDRRVRRMYPTQCIFIRSDQFREQLKQVVETCHLDPFTRLFTRCLECNSRLDGIPKEEVEAIVPAYVFETQEKFSVCRRCQKVLWPATHQERMVEELRRLGFAPFV